MRDAREQVADAAHDAAPWLERLARLGYMSKGAVYFTIGLLAARGVFGAGGEKTDPRGALERIGEQSFGQILLVVLSLGLVGYALWQITRALLDPEGQGHKPKGLVKRFGYGISGVAYITLAWFAMTLAARGRAVGRDGQSEEEWTGRLMSQPLGEWLVVLAGLVALAIAGNQFYVAAKALFLKRLRFGALDGRLCDLIKRTGQVGIAARGVVITIIGLFLIQAAWTHDPEKAGGLSEALAAVERQPFGPWLLGIVALGVIAYGVYAVMQGRYRRIRID